MKLLVKEILIPVFIVCLISLSGSGSPDFISANTLASVPEVKRISPVEIRTVPIKSWSKSLRVIFPDNPKEKKQPFLETIEILGVREKERPFEVVAIIGDAESFVLRSRESGKTRRVIRPSLGDWEGWEMKWDESLGLWAERKDKPISYSLTTDKVIKPEYEVIIKTVQGSPKIMSEEHVFGDGTIRIKKIQANEVIFEKENKILVLPVNPKMESKVVSADK